MLRIRLCDEDRDTYGGPEWVSLDVEALMDLPCSELEDIESQTGGYLSVIVDLVERGEWRSTRVRRVCVWLARRQAKLVDEYDKFDPKIMRAEFVAGDALPPAGLPRPSSAGGPSGSS